LNFKEVLCGYALLIEEIIMKYHYDAEDKHITFCSNNETLFFGDDIPPEYYDVFDFEISYDYIFEIEELGYTASCNSDFHAWNGGFLSGWGDDVPADLEEVIKKLDKAKADYCKRYYDLAEDEDEDDDEEEDEDKT
jgi:hypothetical protein